MNLAQAVSSVLNNYANFQGRSRRSEYWYWSLALFIALVVAEVIAAMSSTLGTVLFFILLVATIVPGLAVAVRRLHDTSRSGAWILLSFVPFGFIPLLVWMCTDSAPGPNMYGPNPKQVEGGPYGQPGYGLPYAG